MTRTHRVRGLVLIGVISVALAAAPAGAQMSEAWSALESGDHERARVLLAPLAQQGNREAQVALGNMLLRGLGGDRDCEAAVGWFERAAGAESAVAQFNLGLIHEGSDCVAPDHAKAIDWYTRSAMQGDPRAQYRLFVLQQPSRPEQSLFWLHSAAQRGLLVAADELAKRYATGTGVEQNWRRAIHWYERAAAAGSMAAMLILYDIHRRGVEGVRRNEQVADRWLQEAKTLARSSSPEAIARAERIAREFGTEQWPPRAPEP